MNIKYVLIEKLLWMKLYWGRSLGHLNIPLSIIDKIMLLIIILKLFNLYSNLFVIIFSVLFIALIMLIGYLDVKYKVYDAEVSMNNNFNPELQKILRNSKKVKT